MGASIIYRPGELTKHTLDVPARHGSGLIEEVLTLFLIVDENESYYIDENTLNKTSISERELQVNRMDSGFQESNLKHTINGFMFGNLMGINLTVGTHAAWHVVSGQSPPLGGTMVNVMIQEALGNVVNMHTPHWHGNTLSWAQQQVDVVRIWQSDM